MPCDQFSSCPDRDKFSCDSQYRCPSLPSCIRISDEYHVLSARRHVLKQTELLGMTRLDSHYVATAVSELANNLFFHTRTGGIIQCYHIEKAGKSGIEVIGHDDCVGIADIEQAMTDGFSTNGGLGSGLGGMQRLMDEFEITSERGVGTHIVMRKWIQS